MVIILPILMKKEINYKNFLDDQNIEIPPLEKFQKLGDDLGSLMINSKGQLHRHVYERGILLYGLIAKNRPDTVLEIGTGLGYSTLCMAWAMAENNIPGTIFTVDRYSLDVLQKRFYFSEKTNVPKIEFSSNHECWSKIAPKNWLNKITPLTGYSGKILKNSKLRFINLKNRNLTIARLGMIYGLKIVVSNGLHLLGVKPLEVMK